MTPAAVARPAGVKTSNEPSARPRRPPRPPPPPPRSPRSPSSRCPRLRRRRSTPSRPRSPPTATTSASCSSSCRSPWRRCPSAEMTEDEAQKLVVADLLPHRGHPRAVHRVPPRHPVRKGWTSTLTSPSSGQDGARRHGQLSLFNTIKIIQMAAKKANGEVDLRHRRVQRADAEDRQRRAPRHRVHPARGGHHGTRRGYGTDRSRGRRAPAASPRCASDSPSSTSRRRSPGRTRRWLKRSRRERCDVP